MGYCLTTMEIALKLLSDEPDLIKIEEETVNAPTWVEKRNSIIGVSIRHTISIKQKGGQKSSSL
jgi:hypothetical protein